MVSSGQPTLTWNDCSRRQWDALLARAGRSSLEQSWSHGAATAAHYGATVDRVVIEAAGAPLGIAQLVRRRALGLATIVRIMRGPLWLNGDAEPSLRAAAYRALRAAFRRRRREALFWTPELVDTAESHGLMRAAGTRRVVTGYSSGWLNLSPDEDALRAGLAGKWRNALCEAERSGTSVALSHGGKGLPALMADYDAARKAKRFVGPPGAFVSAIADAGKTSKDVLVVTARVRREAIAGVVLVRHGASATYYVSWTSAEGRRRRAHNLLLWRGILALKKDGTRWLDVGGLDTQSAPGVARFKLGLKPELFTLAGTFF